MSDLTFKNLAKINKQRSVESYNHNFKDWSVAEWTNALAGEVGEAANIGKKILRHTTHNESFRGQSVELLKYRLGDELADVVLYADLIAQVLGFRLEDLIRHKFNTDSVKRDVKERL